MYKVVRLFPYQEGVQLEQSVLEGIAEVVERPSYTEKEIIEDAKDADVIICIYENINRNVIEALTHLKMIAFKSIGFNSVDLLNHTATMGIMLGNPNYQRKGYGIEAVKLILDYGFSFLNLRNISLSVFEYNEA